MTSFKARFHAGNGGKHANTFFNENYLCRQLLTVSCDVEMSIFLVVQYDKKITVLETIMEIFSNKRAHSP